MMNALSALLATRTVPVFNASMAGAAGADLASAVSTAGGIGMIGVPSNTDLSALAASAERLHSEDAVWGAGFLSFALEKNLDPLKRVLEYQPAVVSLGFGHSATAVEAVRDTCAVLLAQVGNSDELDAALAAGVDGVIVRGGEGGGHGRNEIATLPFLQLAVERTDRPIVAAGGITTARGLAAVMAAGASAAWIGTRFTVATESDFPDAAKQRVCAAQPGDTVYTRAFDIAQRASWPEYYGGRALANAFSMQWSERVAELEQRVRSDDALVEDMVSARVEARYDTAPIYAGEGAAQVSHIESAAEIMADFARYVEFLATRS